MDSTITLWGRCFNFTGNVYNYQSISNPEVEVNPLNLKTTSITMQRFYLLQKQLTYWIQFEKINTAYNDLQTPQNVRSF